MEQNVTSRIAESLGRIEAKVNEVDYGEVLITIKAGRVAYVHVSNGFEMKNEKRQ